MINQNNIYKNKDINDNNKRINIQNFFNPYEYNLESNLKNQQNMDIICQKSICHHERIKIKK